MAEFDIVVKGGTVVDGTRLPRYPADIAITDGRIVQIGNVRSSQATRVLDASGLVVAPGFVDLHTHYDAQIQWDPYCTISGWHGVTSVAIGNCGFGFAPVRPEERERAMLTMSRNEAIPLESMREGMLWDWITFPEFMDSLERIPKGVNVLTYMPVSPLLTWVMGLEAAKTRRATAAERLEMQRLLNEAMDAGACGFSVQRFGAQSIQSDYDGTPMVTDIMSDEEVLALGEVLHKRNEGIVQISQLVDALPFEEKLAKVTGLPVLHNVILPAPGNPEAYRELIAWIADCNRRGLRIFGQGATQRAGYCFTLEHWSLYDASPAWSHATTGSHDEKLKKLADPKLRAGIKAESESTVNLTDPAGFTGPIPELVINGVDEREEFQSYEGKTLGQVAAEQGKHPVDVMLDLSVATGLKAEFMVSRQARGTTAFDAECSSELYLTSPHMIGGVSDGGAHVKMFNGGAYPTDMLSWLVRDEQKLTLEEAHYRLSYLPAHAAGFRDRGIIREGAPADIVAYDLEHLAVKPQWIGEVVHDFPGGEWRRVQRAEGYRWILVNGDITSEDGKCTGATPGRLLRHGHAA